MPLFLAIFSDAHYEKFVKQKKLDYRVNKHTKIQDKINIK